MGPEVLTAPWEEVVACGACGSRDVRFSGSIGRRRFAICRGCGIERLYDRVAETSLDLLYGTYYAPDDPSPLALEQQLRNPTFAHRQRRLHQFAGTRARRILEIGCGDGNFLETLRRAGWDVHGQEVSASTAAIVERRHGIPVTAGALEAIPSVQPFPVVAAYHVFEHIYHPAAWLRSVHRLIEPRGLLHVQVPNAASLTRRLSGGEWASLVFPQHTYFYEPSTLRALLERFGFTVLSHTTWDPWHGPGAVSASASNVISRLVTGRHSWSDIVVAPSGPSLECASPRARSPIKAMMRTGLDFISIILARLESAIDRGAVVDIVAQRE
jgi:2-polyprenyl-3-methyl-5-hydroxy-6-metoxy-1,4-benzoquinol methylase